MDPELASAAPEYAIDPFIEQPNKQPQDVQYDRLRQFATQFQDEMVQLESKVKGYEAHPTAWSSLTDIIALDTTPRSNESLESVLGSALRDNKLLHRIFLTFLTLGCEIREVIAEIRTRHFPPLLLFGKWTRTYAEDSEAARTERQLAFGRFLPSAFGLWASFDRLRTLVVHTVTQLASLHGSARKGGRDPLLPYAQVRFKPVWCAVADALSLFVELDCIVASIDALSEAEDSARRVFVWTLKALERKRDLIPDVEWENRSMKRFQWSMLQLQTDLFDGQAFIRAVSALAESRAGNVVLAQSAPLKALWAAMCDESLHEVPPVSPLSTLCTAVAPGSVTRVQHSFSPLSAVTLFCAFSAVYERALRDDKPFRVLFKSVYEVASRTALVHIHGSVSVQLVPLVLQSCPMVASKVLGKAVAKAPAEALEGCLKEVSSTLDLKVAVLNRMVASWIARACSAPSPGSVVGLLERYGPLVLGGLQLAADVQLLLRTTLAVYVACRADFLPKIGMAMKLVALLALLADGFHRMTSQTVSLLGLLSNHLAFRLVRTLLPARTALKQASAADVDDSVVDELSSLEFATHVLTCGPPTLARRFALELAMSIVGRNGSVLSKGGKVPELRQYAAHWATLVQLQAKVREYCSIWWFEPFVADLLPLWLRSVRSQPALVHDLPFVLRSLADIAPYLRNAAHLAKPDALLKAYQDTLMEAMHTEFMQPTAVSVEDDVRMASHSVVLGRYGRKVADAQDQVAVTARDLFKFVHLPPLWWFDRLLVVRHQVEKHLNAAYYNMSTVATNSWRSYEEMRLYAQHAYELSLCDPQLPELTPELAKDAVEITRNIHRFVSRYTYNLNDQMFVERPAKALAGMGGGVMGTGGGTSPAGTGAQQSKYIHTVQISHITASIRSHGLGIMDTTVNYVYRFLTRRINFVSQFLFRTEVRSRLTKEVRWYKENKEACSNMYPLQRATALLKDLRDLGKTPDDVPFVDQFKVLLSEIGNALGYVRLVRTAGHRTIADLTAFLENTDDAPRFHELAAKEVGGERLEEWREVERERRRAEREERRKLERGGMEEDDDSMQLSSEDEDLDPQEGDDEESVDSEGNPLPPKLSDHTIQAAVTLDTNVRDMMSKFAHGSDYFRMFESAFSSLHLANFHAILPALTLSFVEGMVASKIALLRRKKLDIFCDDGFALGVAFFLKVFHQGRAFDSLRWFESVRSEYNASMSTQQESLAAKERAESSRAAAAVAKKVKGGKPLGTEVGGGVGGIGGVAADASVAAGEISTMQHTMQRLVELRDEFEGLLYTFHSARVFFRSEFAEDEEPLSSSDEEEG